MSKAKDATKPKERSEETRSLPPPHTVKPAVSGHPVPQPPVDATEPAALAPAEPLANALLRTAEQASTAPSGGTLGGPRTAPQVPEPTDASPVGMTQPAEEPAPPRARGKNPPESRPKRR